MELRYVGRVRFRRIILHTPSFRVRHRNWIIASCYLVSRSLFQRYSHIQFPLLPRFRIDVKAMSKRCSIEVKAKFYRRQSEVLSKTKRSSIEDKAKFYRTSIEDLSNTYRTYIEYKERFYRVIFLIHLPLSSSIALYAFAKTKLKVQVTMVPLWLLIQYKNGKL